MSAWDRKDKTTLHVSVFCIANLGVKRVFLSFFLRLMTLVVIGSVDQKNLLYWFPRVYPVIHEGNSAIDRLRAQLPLN